MHILEHFPYKASTPNLTQESHLPCNPMYDNLEPNPTMLSGVYSQANTYRNVAFKWQLPSWL